MNAAPSRSAVSGVRLGRIGSGGLRLVTIVLVGNLGGCLAPGAARQARQREIEAAAATLLEMRADANWTACYNRLLELGPASTDHLIRQAIMQQPAAPDDLRVMLHTSLLRLLANPTTAPRLSVRCFETTLDVLHFDPKVRGRRLGAVHLPARRLPVAWHELYPADFDHSLAASVDVEGDRRAMLRWWRTHRGEPATLLAGRPLRPNAERLWPILARRYADVWTYEVKPQAVLCALPPTGSALLRARSYDYNLVRAVCIWLGTSETQGVRGALIELVAHRSPVVAYNARFALARSSDPRIRELLERYNAPAGPEAPPTPYPSVTAVLPAGGDADRWPLFFSSCAEQGSATREVDQVYARLCSGHRHRDADGGEVRGR